MAKIVWDAIGEHIYETGVDHGVLYLFKNKAYSGGSAWNGLIAVNENPSGAEETPLYADNIKYLSLRSAEDFGLSLECYTYPDAWAECDGTASLATGVSIGQQKRSTFGLSYRTLIGNDTDLQDHGYKLHLVYGCTASPSERGYNTVNDSPEAITFSYEITTTPVAVEGFKPTSCITIDSTKADKTALAKLEAILYGSDSEEPRLPMPDEVVKIFSTSTIGNPAAEPVAAGSTFEAPEMIPEGFDPDVSDPN